MTSKISDLRNLPIIATEKVSLLADHLPLSDSDRYYLAYSCPNDLAPNISVYLLVHEAENYKYSHGVYGVTFNGEFIMILRRAGKWGESFFDQYVIETESFSNMMVYIRTEIAKFNSDIDMPPVLSEDDDIPLTFYGKTLTI